MPAFGEDCMQTNLFSKMCAGVLTFFLLLSAAYGQDSKFELGLRGNVMLGDGVPANDMLGYGLIGRYYLKDGWFAGAALDYTEFDFERTAAIVGIVQDPLVNPIDAAATNTILSAFLGRQYGNTDRGFDWFWTAGIGVGFPDVKSVTGPVEGGGTFNITTDAGTEIHLISSLGTSYHFSPAWSATLAGRLEHHFMNYKVTDSESGNTATVDSQTPMGVSLSINYRF